MIRLTARNGALAVTATLSLLAAVPAAADDSPKHGDREIYMDVKPTPLDEDFLITDDMEAQISTIGAGVSCSYESVQSGPNVAPSAPSFQLVYVVPAGETPNPWVDVPRSCSDGSLRYSSLARSSRNMASFLDKQGAGLAYRTVNGNYVHNYTGSTYSTRSARRLISAYTEENWNNTPMKGSPSRLSKLRSEMSAAGFKATSTKYMAMLDAATYQTCEGYDAFGNPYCFHIPGAADLNGPYGMANRSYIDPDWVERTWRYGCATYGDTIFNHEATHTVGANHVGDHARDLMTSNGGKGWTMKSSPSILWDYGRNNYHGQVRANPYVALTAQAGAYFTC